MQSRFATIFIFSLTCTAYGGDAPTVPTDDDDKTKVYGPVPWPGHHEAPTVPGPDQTSRDQKYATPRLQPRRPQQPSRSRWVMGEAVSIQVNVDASGNNILGDAANEPSMAISPVFPDLIVIGWRQFDTISSDFRQAGWATSGNSGETWNFRGVLRPGTFSSDPVLSVDLEGNFYYYSLQPDRGPGVWACYMYKSTDGGVNWTQDIYGYGGDKAWIAIDRTASEGRGNIYTMWSAFAGCCSNGLFTRSRSGGRTFDPPVPLPENPFAGTLTVARDGTVFVAGSTLQFGGRAPVMRSTNAKMGNQAPTFESIAQVSLGGATRLSSGPNPGGLLGQMWIASDNSEGPHAGNLYLLSSVNPPGSDPLDVMFTRSTNGGLTWSDPIRINTDSFGTNAWQWFGTLSVAPNGRLDVVWYDTRVSEDASESQLYYSFSRDGGENWSDDQALSPPFNHSLGYPQQNKLGDYIQTISGVEDLSIAYAATFNGEQDVYFLRIRTLLEECALATAGGFPNRDCNLNGVNDFCDLTNGTSLDENLNFVPDECEKDFDGDGIIDADDSDIDGDGVLNFNDVCDFTPLGALVQDDGRQIGDADKSCSVDLADFQLFQTCFSQAGPDAPTPFRFCTEQFGFDPDDDLDLQDWSGFQAAFTGEMP